MEIDILPDLLGQGNTWKFVVTCNRYDFAHKGRGKNPSAKVLSTLVTQHSALSMVKVGGAPLEVLKKYI
ncbi:hypothetical protein [Nostoc sp.]|uniref:hypothetical protein n=1 Tax=Nostoc sp. TaxID=1180 RepID=UPI002FF52A6E